MHRRGCRIFNCCWNLPVYNPVVFLDRRVDLLQVAALFGDARRALDICRRATEMVDQNSGAKGVVKMSHVDAALQEMYSAPKIVAVRYVCVCTENETASVSAQGSKRVGSNLQFLLRVYTVRG